MADEVPCPECGGWMRVQDDRWACPKCGHQSAEFTAEEAQTAPPPEPTPAALAVEQGVATSSPGRGRLAGRPRSFWVSLLLGLVTLGIYLIYWQWRVFREVHAQERTRGWSGLMLAGGALLLANLVWLFLEDAAGRLGARDDLGAGDLAFRLAGGALLVAYILLETRHLDSVLRTLGRPASGAFAWLALEAVVNFGSLAVPSPASDALPYVGVALAFVGFYKLQAGLNRYWANVGLQPARAAPTALTPAPS